MATSLAEKAEHFSSSFGFLVPLLIPWMHQLCAESATDSMRMLYKLPETLPPISLIPQTKLKFETIRDSIIPQLFKFIMSTPDPKKYLTDRFNYYSNVNQLTERRFELFISSLISDLITYAHYQRTEQKNKNNKNNNYHDEFLSNMLPLELSMIIQYIKMLIWEYYQSIDSVNKQYEYDEKLCTKSLLTILNHEYTHHLLIERYHQNSSHFSMFAEYLHENALQLHKFKTNEIHTQKHTVEVDNDFKSKTQTRPASQSLPQKKKPPSPLPVIQRIDIQPTTPPIHSLYDTIDQKELPPPPEWMPLEQMYELFEPNSKKRKKFQRIRESEEIPPPPKTTLPPIKNYKHKNSIRYRIKPKEKSNIMRKPKPLSPAPIATSKSTSPAPIDHDDKNLTISIQTSITTPTYGAAIATENNNNKQQIFNSLSDGETNIIIADRIKKKPLRRIRTMTLSRPAKLESLSKDEFMGKYLVETSKIIGQGSFAKIYRCKKKYQDTILAMKIVKKQKANKDDVRAMRREISALALVYHKNVIKIHDWCETTQHIFIVLDYCGGGNVFDRVMEQQTFTEIQASKLIRQVALALEHLHSLGIVHRDLKPENLMYVDQNDNTMKIIDFGLSNRIKINGIFMSQMDIQKHNIIPQQVFSLETPCGTPHYAAPELIKNEKYGTPVDLWALGVIVYMLLCGFPPFFDTNIKNMFQQIKKGKITFPSPFWDGISNQAKDLILKLLNVDAKKRYTAQQTLSHPWTTGEYFQSYAFQSSEIDNVDNISLPPEDNDNISDILSDDNEYKTPEPSQKYSLDTHPLVLSDDNSIVVHKNDNQSIDIKNNNNDNNDTKYGVIGTPINENESEYNLKLLSPKQQSIDTSNYSNDINGNNKSVSNITSIPSVPFHVGSQLFPETSIDLRNDQDEKKMSYKQTRTRSRVNTRGTTNVAYMVDGTIFQRQKQQINKLKLEIQSEQQKLDKLSNKLQIERHKFIEERQTFYDDKKQFENAKIEWINKNKNLKQLKCELNDVVNKFLTF